MVKTSANELENGPFYQDGKIKPQNLPNPMDMSQLFEHLNNNK
jgi:hypothetical protein